MERTFVEPPYVLSETFCAEVSAKNLGDRIISLLLSPKIEFGIKLQRGYNCELCLITYFLKCDAVSDIDA